MIYKISAIAICACLVGVVQADAIPVGDHSFESAAPNPGNWSNGPHGTWTEDVDGSNGSFIEHITGFAAEGTRHIGINALTTSIAGGIVPDGTFQYSVFQDLGVPLEANTEYTLTVGVGKRNEGFNPPGGIAAFGVEVGGVTQATGSYDASPLPDATFVDQSISFITTAAPAAGNIVIKLSNIDAGLAAGEAAVGARAHFDNIRLEANAVPEPGSIALIATMALGLVVLRRRK